MVSDGDGEFDLQYEAFRMRFKLTNSWGIFQLCSTSCCPKFAFKSLWSWFFMSLVLCFFLNVFFRFPFHNAISCCFFFHFKWNEMKRRKKKRKRRQRHKIQINRLLIRPWQNQAGVHSKCKSMLPERKLFTPSSFINYTPKHTHSNTQDA